MTSVAEPQPATPEPAPKFRRRRQGAQAAAAALGLGDEPSPPAVGEEGQRRDTATATREPVHVWGGSPPAVRPVPDDVQPRAQRLVDEQATDPDRPAPSQAATLADTEPAGSRVRPSSPDPRPSIQRAPPQAEAVDGPADVVLDLPTQQTSIYISPTALAKAKRLAQVDQTTYANVVMDAIDTALDSGELEGLVRDRQVVERHEGSRFPARRASRRRARGPGNSRVLWPIQLTEEERTVLADIEAETGASSRSALVAAAVEWYVEIPKIRRRIGEGGRSASSAGRGAEPPSSRGSAGRNPGTA